MEQHYAARELPAKAQHPERYLGQTQATERDIDLRTDERTGRNYRNLAVQPREPTAVYRAAAMAPHRFILR
ncbi:hypothetical protein D3C80_924970 [compost metagenome]